MRLCSVFHSQHIFLLYTLVVSVLTASVSKTLQVWSSEAELEKMGDYRPLKGDAVSPQALGKEDPSRLSELNTGPEGLSGLEAKRRYDRDG